MDKFPPEVPTDSRIRRKGADARGQNIWAIALMRDDVVNICSGSVANGHRHHHVFDYMNDIRNLRLRSARPIKKGRYPGGAYPTTLGSAYTLEYWVDIAKEESRIWCQFYLNAKDTKPEPPVSATTEQPSGSGTSA